MWSDNRLIELLDIEVPIIQAPMAGSDGPDLAASVSAAGGLGSVGTASMTPDAIAEAVDVIRQTTNRPFNLNFFCHAPPEHDPDVNARWIDTLRPYYADLGVVPPESLSGGPPTFDEGLCDLVVTLRPPVVSFHFGLPSDDLVERLKGAGCRILSTATTPGEAILLQSRGVDAVIAQGAEAGGHRGVFAEDWRHGSGQIGTMALVPQVADAVTVPVIAAGGIASGRGIAASFALGAAGVQIGTAYLFTPEAKTNPMHRAALEGAKPDETILTNVYSGRPARAIVSRFVRETGPIAPNAPEFPLPFTASAPLSQASQAAGSQDFVAAWAGQAVAMGRKMPAGELTQELADSALMSLAGLSAAH
jgi:nitronate monooxygenase